MQEDEPGIQYILKQPKNNNKAAKFNDVIEFKKVEKREKIVIPDLDELRRFEENPILALFGIELT